MIFRIYDDSSAAESVEAAETEEVAVPTSSNSSVSTNSSNAFVMIDPLQDTTDDETESSRQFVKVELSVSETRPVRSSGSGEEDNEEEPPTFSAVSTPASSIHTYSQSLHNSQNNEQGTVGSSDSPQRVEVDDPGMILNELHLFYPDDLLCYERFI